MTLHFTRVETPVHELEIWMACSSGFSFVISNESRTGPGLHGHDEGHVVHEDDGLP